MHRSRLCYFVIDVLGLDHGTAFWAAALGATRWDHQAERGWDFWVLHDPWGNEFCVLPPMLPDLLAQREPWNEKPAAI